MRTSILIFCGLAFISLHSNLGFAEHSANGIAVQSVEACRVDLTQIGRQGTFTINVFYRASVDDYGAIVDLKPVSGENPLSPFVQLGQFESCMRRWRFRDPGEYLIHFSAGTTGKRLMEWEINVSIGGKLLKVTLPRLQSQPEVQP